MSNATRQVSVQFGKCKFILEGFGTPDEGVDMAVALIRKLAELDLDDDILAKLARQVPVDSARIMSSRAGDSQAALAGTGPAKPDQISLTTDQLVDNPAEVDTETPPEPQFHSKRPHPDQSEEDGTADTLAETGDWRLEVARLEASIDKAIHSLKAKPVQEVQEAPEEASGPTAPEQSEAEPAAEAPATPMQLADPLTDDQEATPAPDPAPVTPEPETDTPPAPGMQAEAQSEPAEAKDPVAIEDSAPAEQQDPATQSDQDEVDTVPDAQELDTTTSTEADAPSPKPESPAEVVVENTEILEPDAPATASNGQSAAESPEQTVVTDADGEPPVVETSEEPKAEIVEPPSIEKIIEITRVAVAKAAEEHKANGHYSANTDADYYAIEDKAIDRLMETTNSMLDDAEHTRKSQSLERLKAAVVATEAERRIKVKTARGTVTLDFEGPKSTRQKVNRMISPPEPTPEMRAERIQAYRKMIAARKMTS